MSEDSGRRDRSRRQRRDDQPWGRRRQSDGRKRRSYDPSREAPGQRSARPRRRSENEEHTERGARQGDHRGEPHSSRRGSRGRGDNRDARPDRGERSFEGRPEPREFRGGRGGTRGAGRSDRGGREREFTEAERLQHALRPVRERHEDPELPESVRVADLPAGARNELKTLEKANAEQVARHLAMVARLIHTDPELAHQHAISASRRAGRIPVVRETLAMTSYRLGDFAQALREFRTYRRLTGSDTHLALMIDCQRGLGRPARGLELAREANQSNFNAQQRVHTAIALSGARLDLGQTQQALIELEIPELNPDRAFIWSGELFRAYAAVLSDLGRQREASQWEQRADEADAAIDSAMAADGIEVFEVEEVDIDDDTEADVTPGSDAEAEK